MRVHAWQEGERRVLHAYSTAGRYESLLALMHSVGGASMLIGVPGTAKVGLGCFGALIGWLPCGRERSNLSHTPMRKCTPADHCDQPVPRALQLRDNGDQDHHLQQPHDAADIPGAPQGPLLSVGRTPPHLRRASQRPLMRANTQICAALYCYRCRSRAPSRSARAAPTARRAAAPCACSSTTSQCRRSTTGATRCVAQSGNLTSAPAACSPGRRHLAAGMAGGWLA